jgi:ribonucleoside-diphosphate reductase alpha chain
MVASGQKKTEPEPDIVAANRNALRDAVAATLAAGQRGDLLEADHVNLDAVTDLFLARMQTTGDAGELIEDLMPIASEAVTTSDAYNQRLKSLLQKDAVQGQLNGTSTEMATTKKRNTRRSRSKTNGRAPDAAFSWDASDEPDPSTWLSENAMAVLERRYLAKDRDGNTTEDPRGMFLRVARTMAAVETEYQRSADVDEWARKFYRMIANLEFVPNSPTLMNAGRELGQLSACFVLPVEDSIDAIFDSVKFTAQIHKSGGGTGFAFSRLRPEGDVVGSTGGVASGPVSFIKIFDAATEQVKQGGTRRGANMGILHVQHPDVEKFIHAKDDNATLQNFNISLAVTDAFMEALASGGDFDLINPHSGEVTGRLNAREVFEDITKSAWKTGDPGMIFIDKINAQNPTPALGQIESTNPCGEQPLLPYESCNLGSINLNKVLRPGTGAGTGLEVDWDQLGEIVALATRFLDNVIDANNYPIPQIDEMSKKTRRIGLGIMGWADILTRMGIPYDSNEALALGEQVMGFIQERTWKASQDLAEERGPFPAFYGSMYDVPDARPMRNSAPTTIAPTGTISIIAEASSGIEPLFALSYVRNVMDRTRLVEVNPWFKKAAEEGGYYSDDLMRQLADVGSVRGLDGVPVEAQQAFATSHDIAPQWHVRMQAAFQKYTDNAVSKTINLPHDATIDDVADAYRLAYELDCKGITIYRDGSKDEQVLSTGRTIRPSDEADPDTEPPVGAYRVPRTRPGTLSGVTERIRTGHGNVYITITKDEEGNAFEVFTNLGKAGSDDSAYLEAVSRLASLALRSGIDPAQVIEQLKGITCHPTWDEGHQVLSAPDALAIALMRHAAPPDLERKELKRLAQETFADKISLEEFEPEARLVATQPGLLPGRGQPAPAPSTPAPNHPTLQCPDCYSALIVAEGCLLCTACGYSKC